MSVRSEVNAMRPRKVKWEPKGGRAFSFLRSPSVRAIIIIIIIVQ